MDNRQCRERYEIHEKPGLAFGAPGPDELRDLVTTFFKIKTRAPANKIYCELREQTYDRYHRSNMWLKVRTTPSHALLSSCSCVWRSLVSWSAPASSLWLRDSSCDR